MFIAQVYRTYIHTIPTNNFITNRYFEEHVIELNKTRLLQIVRFSNLSNEKEDDIPNLMKYAWDIILSTNPTTKNIFLKGKGFDIQHKSTYKKLILTNYLFQFSFFCML